MEKELRIEAAAPARGFQTVAEDVLSTCTLLHLRWTGGVPRPTEDPETLGFCLPAGERITARWVGGRLGGKPLQILKTQAVPTTLTQADTALSDHAGTVDSAGILRHWPIYSLKPSRSVYELLERSTAHGGRPELELTLELAWQNPWKDKPTSAPLSRGGQSWLSVVRGLVHNPGSVERFRVADPPLPREVSLKITDPRRTAPGNRPWARLEVTSAGLTRLDPDALLKAGWPAETLKPEAIRIFSHGKAVPLLLAPGPQAPAGIKPGIYFLAQRGDEIYSASRTYWVTLGADLPPCRLEELGNLPAPEACQPVLAVRRTAERNIDQPKIKTRQGNFMAIEGMAWVERDLEVGKAFPVTLELPDYVPGSGPVEAEMDFFINREDALSPFKIEAVSDREVLGNFTFFSVNDGVKKFNVPEHCIKDGKVTVAVRLQAETPLPTDADAPPDSGFWFDRFRVTYPARPRLNAGRLTLTRDEATTGPRFAALAGDGPTSSPLLALLVAADRGARGILPLVKDAQGQKGIRYLLAKGEQVNVFDPAAALETPEPNPAQLDDLAGENQGADLVIIAHRDFMRQAETLKQFHEGEGWTVRLVDVQSVYDTFSDGELSPLALRSFLAYTLRHWKRGAPAHVLLLGDCTSDYLNRTRSAVRNWVPTYSFNRGGECWAADAWLTMVAGEDHLGDMMIGRLSVASEKDADAVTAKSIEYARTPKPGPWRARLAFVSDDGEFPEVVDELRRNDTPPDYAVSRVFLNEMPLEDNWYLPSSFVERKQSKVSRAATTRILDIFRSGVSFLTYYGHGSPNIWTDERIWFGGDSPNSDNQHLAGSGTCSFVANMTCNSGAIDYPLAPWNVCITEDMMRIENGGAIACFVPSGPGVTSIHREMSRALGRALFDKGLRRFGEVTMLAKARYALGGNPDDLIYMYHLLGDPLVSLQLTERRGAIRPEPAVAVPGQTVSWTLTGAEPAAGQWIAELTGGDGAAIWSSGKPAAYSGGRIPLRVGIPKDARSDAAAVLRVYAWDPESGKDATLAGPLAVQRPQLALERVEVTTASTVRVTIQNPTGVAAGGKLTVQYLDGVTSCGHPKAVEGTLAPAGETKSLEWPWNPGDAMFKGPVAAEVTLAMAEPPDDPTAAQVVRKRVLVRTPAGWTGWVAPLCEVTERTSQSAVVRLSAAVPRGSGDWIAVLRTPGEAMVTTQPLAIDLAAATTDGKTSAGLLTAIFTLEAGQYERILREGAVTMEPAGMRNDENNKEFQNPRSLRLAGLPRRRAELRIVPGSIRTRPKRPTEGDTVFVDLMVENTGNLEADPATVELLRQPLEKGGELASDMMQNGPRQLVALAPGRRVPMTLRWDPIGNAGRQTLYAHLRQAAAMGGAGDQSVPVVIEAKTKSKLAVGQVAVAATSQDIAQHRMTIKAELKNSGQTDAHNVMVSFYRSGLPIPENLLGEPQELKVVPGDSVTTATFVWHYDPARDMVQGTQMPRPTVQVWLKGSTQRVSNVEEKE